IEAAPEDLDLEEADIIVAGGRGVGNYQNDKEGQERCLLCYELRLKKTFELFCQKQFDYFTTTLTMSPHKDSKQVLSIGRNISKRHFLPIDFKKREGFKKTIQLVKKHNMYRQNYCGCAYSLKGAT
ncbi:MAG: epoxyqueuosine reductase QueH, partial [Candidatus Omnitrophota bacterium]